MESSPASTLPQHENREGSQNEVVASRSKLLSTKPQHQFSETLASIHSRLMHGDMAMDNLRQPAERDKMHILTRLVGGRPRLKKVRPESDDAMPLLFEEGVATMEALEEGRDDGLSKLTADEYMNFRLQPVMEDLERSAGWLSLWAKLFSGILFIITAATTVLGLIEQTVWIPIAVGFASNITVTEKFFCINDRLRRTNDALTGLKSQKIWWNSLSMVQKRYGAVKKSLVETTERIIAAQANVFRKGPADPSAADEENNTGKNVHNGKSE